MELPADKSEAIEAFLLMDVRTFLEIGIILEQLADAYVEAVQIRNGEATGKSH